MGYELEEDGFLGFQGRMYIHGEGGTERTILKESHREPYCAQPCVKKMYADMKKFFLWAGMKHNIVLLVAKCLECQQVKDDHHHPTNLLQPHDIPTTKWEVISMDFVVGLPLTPQRHNAILVVIDKLTKSPHFLLVRDTHDVHDVARVFINEIIIFRGVPKKYHL